MKLFKFLIVTSLIYCASCSRSNDIKIICPVGAPSICFYTEIENENFTTESSTPKVVAQFQEENYDAIVIDVTSGLNAIKAYGKPYGFAKLLTAGNLYLVSSNNSDTPKDGEKILSFGSTNSIPYLSLKRYCETCGKTDFTNEGIVEIKDGVSLIAPILKQDLLESHFRYDYYLLADPVLSSLKNEKGFDKLKVTLLKDKMGIIPQAGLFLNKNSLKNKGGSLRKIIDDVAININNCVNNYNEVVSYLEKFESQYLQSRFGFNSAVFKNVQEHNGFALFDQKNTYGKDELNTFFKDVGAPLYEDDIYYIDL